MLEKSLTIGNNKLLRNFKVLLIKQRVKMIHFCRPWRKNCYLPCGHTICIFHYFAHKKTAVLWAVAPCLLHPPSGWQWRQQAPLKRRQTSTKQHGAITQHTHHRQNLKSHNIPRLLVHTVPTLELLLCCNTVNSHAILRCEQLDSSHTLTSTR
jgi:hypothetical protein